jgi:CRP/FNR family cyclic AMP-dependent transcriptional regulator
VLTSASAIASVLRTVDLFSELDEKALRDLAQASTLLQHRTGELIFEEGSLASEVYLVVSGRVRTTCEAVEGPDVVVGYIESEGILGEMGVIDPAPRSATARAAEDSVVLCLPGEALGAFIAQAHPVAAILLTAIRGNMIKRIHGLNERIGALFLSDEDEPQGLSISDRLRSIWTAMKAGG